MEDLGNVERVELRMRIIRENGPDRVMDMTGRAGLLAMLPEGGPEGRGYVYVGGDLWTDWIQVIATIVQHAAPKRPILGSALTTAALKDPLVLEAMQSAIMAHRMITAHRKEDEDHGS